MKRKQRKSRNTYLQIVKEVIRFCEVRGWDPVSSDLAKSIVIEASELLEKFQWDETNKEQNTSLVSPKNKEEIGEEVADVFWYLIGFCRREGIDLLEAARDKLKKNEIKYPANRFKGKHNEKFYVAQKKKYRKMRETK